MSALNPHPYPPCCESGHGPMMLWHRYREPIEIDPADLTEGQLGDYLAGDLSGEDREWTGTVETWLCPTCNRTVKIRLL